MSESDVIVRCPGCGNGKVISVAVGQLLQCDICRTAFQAPVAADPPADPAPKLDPSSTAQNLQPPTQPAVTQPSTPAKSDSSSQRPPSGSGSSVKRSESWRTDDLEISTEPQATTTPQISTGIDALDSSPELDIREPPSWFWTVVAMFAVGVILTLVVVAGFFIVQALPSANQDRSAVAGPDDNARNGDMHWTNAAKYSQKRGSMKLKVERVFYGSIRVKDMSNQVVNTADDNLLGITVSALNQGTRPRAFENWYGHVFESQQGEDVIAVLVDDQNRNYSLLKFDDVNYVEGQSLAEEIGPQKTVKDTLVFLIPKDVDRSKIKYFRITLPGAAVELSDFFRFAIPQTMIENFDASGMGAPKEGE